MTITRHDLIKNGLLVVLGAAIFSMIAFSMTTSRLKEEYSWEKGSSAGAVRGGPPVTTAEQARAVIATVMDAELDVSIVDLGLVYDIELPSAGQADGTMTMTRPTCPFSTVIIGGVRDALFSSPDVDRVDLHLVFDPPWSWERVSPGIKEQLLHRVSAGESP